MNEARKFISVVIASGLDFDMLTPEDVIRHVSMDIIAHHLPPELIAELLEAALQSDTMSATLVLQTLGVESLAEHVPMRVLWACVAEAASKSLDSLATSPEKPASTPKAVTKAKGKAVTKAKPAAVRAEPEAPVPPVAAKESMPVPLPAPQTLPAPIQVDAAPIVTAEKVAPAQPVAAARKPNRIAEAPAPADPMVATVTSATPAPASPVEVVRHERMQTYAHEEEFEEVSYHDMDTSIGTLEPEAAEVDYGEENLAYTIDGDEVTAFGQE